MADNGTGRPPTNPPCKHLNVGSSAAYFNPYPLLANTPSAICDASSSSTFNGAGVFGGSFQSLLREASAGVLHVADDAFYLEGFSSHGLNNNDSSSRVIVENDVLVVCDQVDESICAEGYNGGTESDVPFNEVGVWETDNEVVVEGNVELLHRDLQLTDNVGDVELLDRNDDGIQDAEFDGLWGINGDSSPGIEEVSDSDDEFGENAKDPEQSIPATALGDCGCVSGCIEVDAASKIDKEIASDEADDEDEDEDVDENEDIVVIDMEQEIYIDPDQNAPYKKRKRIKNNASNGNDYEKRPDCRKPRAMGAIERAMRSAPTRKTEHIFEPVVGMVFDSREEAREFYNMYSWEVGFGVKFNNRRNSGEEYRSMQQIVCQKQGYDPRISKGSKRCGCKAKIQLLRTPDGGWYISSLVKEHNHPLSQTASGKREWTSHREINQCTKDMIRYLKENNVSATKIHCIMGSMFGNLSDVPWTKRSIRTICGQIARDQMDNDVQKTMEIFKGMREEDPGFQFSVELDKRSRVKTLLWCSGRSREQYACFGDVICFDTTYCTNIYSMPFGLFVGVNNHFQTTVFGGVLMRNETTKSFRWVFKEFLHLMGGKPPQTILTDQCKAMTKAIGRVLPETYHLWCKWHIMKNIQESLGPLYTKNKEFRDDFWLVVNGMLSEEEFENGWRDLGIRYNISNHPFMVRTFECRKKWAKPWSKNRYCAGQTSTQRSESANCMLKRFIPRNSSMNHFMRQYSRLLYDRDCEEDREEELTQQLNMKHDGLWSIERHALQIYTRAAFELFRKQVKSASYYILSERDGDIYTISHDSPATRQHWARVHFKVQVIDGGEKFICECGMYEHMGILCCHAIRLMLKLDVLKIPEAHIMKRWTRNARDVLPDHLKAYQLDQGEINSMTFRHRMLYVKALELVKKGDMDLELFKIVIKHLKAADKEVEEVLKARADNTGIGQKDDHSSNSDDCEEDELDVQTEGEQVQRNKYGASGSSAGLSDSEILKLKAPIVVRKRGRPRVTRFKPSSEGFKRKSAKSKKAKNKASKKGKTSQDEMNINDSLEAAAGKNNTNSRSLNAVNTVTKRKIVEKCTTEDLKSQKTKRSTTEKIAEDDGSRLPKQSSFCSVCRKTGHNRASCVKSKQSGQKTVTKKKTRVVQCKRCELTGHTEVQCCYLDVSGATLNGAED